MGNMNLILIRFFFPQLGIVHQTNAPHSPQQNRVIEQENRDLKEIMNAKLISFIQYKDGTHMSFKVGMRWVGLCSPLLGEHYHVSTCL